METTQRLSGNSKMPVIPPGCDPSTSTSTYIIPTKESKIRSCTGHELHCSYWYPSKEIPPRTAVFLSHGFGEYLVTYDRLVKGFLGANMLVFGHDHVGFGRSGGKRAQIDSLDQYCKDVECHVACVKAKLKNIPMYIVGHSMGGVIAVATGAQYPDLFDGVVLLSPGLALDKKFNNAPMRFIGKTLARIAPGAGLIQLEAAAITADTSIIDKYMKDPLIYKGRIKAKWAHAFRIGVEATVKKLPQVRWPFLCIQGENDAWIPCEEIKRIMDTAASADKTVVVIPKALHRVFDEPNGIGDGVCRQVVQWIVDHLEPVIVRPDLTDQCARPSLLAQSI